VTAADEGVIYAGGVVRTFGTALPLASGLRVEGGRVTHVFAAGAELPAGLAGRRVDLCGATVLPGLTDAHLHLQSLGAASRRLDLRGARSEAEAAALVRETAALTPAGHWIQGRGWDQNSWPGGEMPGRAALDRAAPDNPVLLTRVDGHALWVNGHALALAGITAATPDPSGGEILRHFVHGEPTGVLVDTAADLIEDRLPAPTAAEVRANLMAALDLCRRAGLTAVHDMGTSPEALDALRALESEGRLTLRVFVYLGGPWDRVEAALRGPIEQGELVRVVGAKLFVDGALGSRGAALLVPYSDRPDTSGLVVTPPEELARRVRVVDAAGLQVAIHAIGDRANRTALDAIAALGPVRRARRHRIEHAQVVSPGDVARFAALGVVASMQPTHATSDMGWAPARLGPGRLAGAYAWRTLLRAGATLVLGSDAPVESHDPWRGVYAAVTGQDLSGQPPGGFQPAERLTVTEALEGFCVSPAAVVGAGPAAIVPGAPADLTVVDLDPLAPGTSPARLARARALRTVVAGREVWALAGPDAGRTVR
jgi:predicted amidohydrolase YtcJ